MKLLILLCIFINFVYANKAQDLITFEEGFFWFSDSPQCGGTNSEASNKVLVLQLKDSTYGQYKTTNYSTSSLSQYEHYFEDSIMFNGIKCASHDFYTLSSTNSTYNVYYTSDDPTYQHIYQRHKKLRIDVVETCESLTSPTETIIDGFEYQNMVSDYDGCQSLANDNGDGLGFTFVNPHANTEMCTTGYCYYNLADNSSGDTGNNDNTGGDTGNNDNTGGDTGNNDNTGGDTGNNDNTGGDTGNNNSTDDKYDVTQLIPYIDDIETKNQDVVNELQNLNTNLNSNFNDVDSNLQGINTTLQNLDTTLGNLNNDNGDDGLDTVASNANTDLNIDTELTEFQSDYESTLNTSFSTYSDVFGLSGYGSAPNPIKFTFMSTTYTVFDISYLSDYIDNIRAIFLISAYLFGTFLVFKGE